MGDQHENDRTRFAADTVELALMAAMVALAWFWIAVPLANWAIQAFNK